MLLGPSLLVLLRCRIAKGRVYSPSLINILYEVSYLVSCVRHVLILRQGHMLLLYGSYQPSSVSVLLGTPGESHGNRHAIFKKSLRVTVLRV